MYHFNDQKVSYNCFINFWKGIWSASESKVTFRMFIKQNKWQSEKIHLIIPDIQVNKQDKTRIFYSKIFDFIAKSSSVQE